MAFEARLAGGQVCVYALVDDNTNTVMERLYLSTDKYPHPANHASKHWKEFLDAGHTLYVKVGN